MSNKTSFFIVTLDEGYTLTKEGKTIAKEDGSRVKEYLESSFLQRGSESPLISFAVGGMKATKYKDSNFFK